VKRKRYDVRLLRVAEDDLNDLLDFIRAENPAAAQDLLTRIEKKLAILSTHPLLGHVPDDDELVRMGYRFLVVGNYLIFYTVEAPTVLIHRIIHGARDYLDLL